ncbi:hypothetical protein [Chromohalobacter canadensis]|uniref:hypothetical protein n=1 Tax=Chromohalobacter canadensis TaxID=141389 RepID=UPI0035EDD760
MLAWLPSNEVERLLPTRGLDKVTPNTLDTPSRLRDALGEIRRTHSRSTARRTRRPGEPSRPRDHDETGRAAAAEYRLKCQVLDSRRH